MLSSGKYCQYLYYEIVQLNEDETTYLGGSFA